MLPDAILKAIKAFHLGEKHKGRDRIFSQEDMTTHVMTTMHPIHSDIGSTHPGEPSGLLFHPTRLQNKVFLWTISHNHVVGADGRNETGGRGAAGIGN